MGQARVDAEFNFEEQSMRASFVHIWQQASIYIKSLPKWEKLAHIFWLLGPFILLIERSPADLWLSLLVIAFIVRSFILKDGAWLRAFWVKAAFLFWGVTLLSGAFSADPSYAMGEAFVWFRFPLFAMAVMYWLGRERYMLYAMLVAMAMGLVIMCGILTAELLIEGTKGGRLEWPYGDTVPGNYVAKACLPVFLVMVALAVSVKGRLAGISGLVALFTMFISVMTGERINFLIRACGGMLAGLIWKPNLKRYLGLVIIEVLAVVIVLQAVPDMGQRYVGHFISQLPTSSQSHYYKAMRPGIMAFEQSPLLGIGTGNLRYMCEEVAGDQINEVECYPHPHNFYVQLIGETGLLGLICGAIFLWSIVWVCLRASWRNRDNVILATAWIVPFGMFWPIATTADFFGQWNNIFMWSAVAFALASVNLQADASAKTKS